MEIDAEAQRELWPIYEVTSMFKPDGALDGVAETIFEKDAALLHNAFILVVDFDDSGYNRFIEALRALWMAGNAYGRRTTAKERTMQNERYAARRTRTS